MTLVPYCFEFWVLLKLLCIAAPVKPRCWQLRVRDELNIMKSIYYNVLKSNKPERPKGNAHRRDSSKIWNGFCGDFRNTEECPFVILSKFHLSLHPVVKVRFYWVQHSSARWSALLGFIISVILFIYDF